MNCDLVSYLNTLCLTQGHEDFSSMDSSESLYFIFRSMIHFWLIYLKCVLLEFELRGLEEVVSWWRTSKWMFLMKI